jgi:hypothetical protein
MTRFWKHHETSGEKSEFTQKHFTQFFPICAIAEQAL